MKEKEKNNLKAPYSEPQVEALEMNSESIICASGDPTDDDF